MRRYCNKGGYYSINGLAKKEWRRGKDEPKIKNVYMFNQNNTID